MTIPKITTAITKDIALQKFINILIGYMVFFGVACSIIYTITIGYVLLLFIAILFSIKMLVAKRIIASSLGAVLLGAVSVFYAIPFSVYYSGGFSSLTLCWYLIVPVASILFLGVGVRTYTATALCIASIAGFALLDYYNIKFSGFNADYIDLGKVLNISGVIGLTFHLSGMFEKHKYIAQKSLASEEQLFVKQTEHLPGVLFQFELFKDGSSRYRFLSEGLRELFGLDPEVAKSNSQLIFDRIHPEDFPFVKKQLLKSASDKRDWEYEYRLLFPDNTIKWVKGSAKAELQQDRKSIVWYGYIYDSTREKKSEIALFESQENVRQITATINDVFYLYDITNKKYLYISPNCKDILGAGDDLFYSGSTNIKKYIHPDDLGLLKDATQKVDAGISYNIDYRMIRDDEIVWLNERSYPIRDKNGTIVKNSGLITNITGRKLIEEQLKESQDNIRQIASTINDVFFLYNCKEKKYLFISPNCKQILGAEDSYFYQGSNKYTNDYVHADDRKMLLEVYDRLDEGEYELDYRIIVNGEIRWLNEKSYAIRDESGICINISGIISDITERKQSQQLLLDSEARFRDIFENTFELIQNVSLSDGSFAYVNPAWLKALEYTPEEVRGLKFQDIIHAESLDHCLEMFHHIAQGNSVPHLEATFVSKSGKKIYVEGQSGCIYDKGRLVTTRGLFRDITTRRLTDEQLIKSQADFERAQELAHIGSWELNFFNPEPVWSKEMYRIFEAEGVPANRINEIVQSKILPSEYKIIEEGLQRVIKTGKVKSIDFKMQCADGGTKFLSAIAEPIRSKRNKKVIGVKGTVQDITKQKLAAQAKSNFLSTMSHEIRTPLNGVIGISNLLLEEELTANQKEYVDTLNFSAQHLSTIVSDILDFSKIESETFAFENLSFNLEQVCSNVFKLFQAKAAEKELIYTFHPAAIEETSLYGDYVRLSQVLSNLLSNAVKFTQAGSVSFGYSIKQEDNKTITISFQIKDTGIGIPQHQQKRIFEGFLQADDSVTRNYGGTGLGLTISKRLVELQGGTITLDSTQGVGSLFAVEMTFDKHSFTKSRIIKNETAGPDNRRLDGMKILVVEDNKINAMVLTRFLNKWRIQNKVAGNGKEALEMLAAEEFNLVLMDLQMPVMDGREATKIIRQSGNEQISAIPIIALTADAMIESHRELLTNGFNDSLTKPFSPEGLYKLLAKYQSGQHL